MDALFPQFFEHANDALFILSQSGRFVDVNPKFVEIVGIPKEEIIGKTTELFLPGGLAQSQERVKQILREGKLGPYEVEATTPLGKKVLSISAFTFHENGAPVGVIGIARDITAYKQMEKHRQALNTELEQRVAERTAALQRSNEDLERFAYMVSHDLQEPLRTVTSFIQLLDKRYKAQLDTDGAEFIDYALEGAQRMQQLIQDLLTYSRVGTQGQEFSETDCEAVLAQTLHVLQTAIAESGAEVTHDPLPAVWANAMQVAQVFQNLLSNALKFRGAEPLRIHLSARQDGQQWLFAVRDNGIGIEPRHAERIFVIFQRLHPRREYPGTGIGLAVCQKIVQRHGGRIWVESEPGKGSTFFFTIGRKGNTYGQDERE
ncbi:MAG: sensor histidine kinase [Candidatus Binatia bacterium]